jgi:CDP-diglyceride synthetase
VSNFKTRSITGIVFVAILIGSIIAFPPYSFGLLILILIALGLSEFYSLMVSENCHPNKIIGMTIG